MAARHACAQDVVDESCDERRETPPTYDDSSHSGEIGLPLSPAPSPIKPSTSRASHTSTGDNCDANCWLGAESTSNPRQDEASVVNSKQPSSVPARFPDIMEEESDTRETNVVPVHPNLLRNVTGSPSINGLGNLPLGGTDHVSFAENGMTNVDASAVVNGAANVDRTQLMESRIIQLEQTISTLSSVCQNLLLQQRHMMDQGGTNDQVWLIHVTSFYKLAKH